MDDKYTERNRSEQWLKSDFGIYLRSTLFVLKLSTLSLELARTPVHRFSCFYCLYLCTQSQGRDSYAVCVHDTNIVDDALMP